MLKMLFARRILNSCRSNVGHLHTTHRCLRCRISIPTAVTSSSALPRCTAGRRTLSTVSQTELAKRIVEMRDEEEAQLKIDIEEMRKIAWKMQEGIRTRRHRRVQIINVEALEKILSRIDLSEWEGCQLIEMNPGMGLSSRILQQKIKPSRHILLEPNKAFHPILQENFINNLPVPANKCRIFLHKEDGYEWDTLEKLIAKKSLKPEYVTPSQGMNTKILFFGNLAMKGIDGDRLATQYLETIPKMSWLQRYGRVRMIVWATHDMRHRFIPRMVKDRQRVTALAELCAEIVEVAGGKYLDLDIDWYQDVQVVLKELKPKLAAIDEENRQAAVVPATVSNSNNMVEQDKRKVKKRELAPSTLRNKACSEPLDKERFLSVQLKEKLESLYEEKGHKPWTPELEHPPWFYEEAEGLGIKRPPPMIHPGLLEQELKDRDKREKIRLKKAIQYRETKAKREIEQLEVNLVEGEEPQVELQQVELLKEKMIEEGVEGVKVTAISAEDIRKRKSAEVDEEVPATTTISIATADGTPISIEVPLTPKPLTIRSLRRMPLPNEYYLSNGYDAHELFQAYSHQKNTLDSQLEVWNAEAEKLPDDIEQLEIDEDDKEISLKSQRGIPQHIDTDLARFLGYKNPAMAKIGVIFSEMVKEMGEKKALAYMQVIGPSRKRKRAMCEILREEIDTQSAGKEKRLMQWNHRTFEPIMTQDSDFYPQEALCLLDIRPRELPRWLRPIRSNDDNNCNNRSQINSELATSRWELLNYFLRNLFNLRAKTLTEALNTIAPGMDQLLKDIPDMDSKKKIREISTFDLVKIAEKYETWPFRNPDQLLEDGLSVLVEHETRAEGTNSHMGKGMQVI